jgi:pimeloyl-ACP methyl ester carboxylesterase
MSLTHTSDFPWHQLNFTESLLTMPSGHQVNVATCRRESTDKSTVSVLFIHGVLRNWRSFYPLFGRLEGRANLYSMDLRGHGNSQPRPNAYRVIDYVEDATAVLTQLQGSIVVWGHSLGAMVALAASGRVGARVKCAILEDPPFSTMGKGIAETPLGAYFRSVEECVRGPDVATATSVSEKTEKLFHDFSNIVVGQRPDGSLVRIRDQRDLNTRQFAAEALASVDASVLEPINRGSWLDGYELLREATAVGSDTRIMLLQAAAGLGGMLTDGDVGQIRSVLRDRCELARFQASGHSIHWADPERLTEMIVSEL